MAPQSRSGPLHLRAHSSFITILKLCKARAPDWWKEWPGGWLGLASRRTRRQQSRAKKPGRTWGGAGDGVCKTAELEETLGSTEQWEWGREGGTRSKRWKEGGLSGKGPTERELFQGKGTGACPTAELKDQPRGNVNDAENPGKPAGLRQGCEQACGDFPRRTRAVGRRGEPPPVSEGRAAGAGGRWVPRMTQQRGPRPTLPARRRGVHVSDSHVEGSLPLSSFSQ